MNSGGLDGLTVRAATESDVAEIAAWRYEGPWAVYDVRADDVRPDLADYRSVVDADSGEVVGFYCVGAAARVTGLMAESGTVDLGVGLRPDLVGRGLGQRFAGVVLSDLRCRQAEPRVRAVVQVWNLRSLRLAASMGLTVAGSHECEQGGQTVEYVVLRAAFDSLPI